MSIIEWVKWLEDDRHWRPEPTYRDDKTGMTIACERRVLILPDGRASEWECISVSTDGEHWTIADIDGKPYFRHRDFRGWDAAGAAWHLAKEEEEKQ